jgi:RNA-directed DNA polymerase
VHISESLDFWGFRIRGAASQGTSKWCVYTFIAERPIGSVNDRSVL